MKTIELKKTAALLIPVAAMGLAMQVQAADMKPVANDSSKMVVVDSSGNCVLSADGRAAMAPECGLMEAMAPEGDADGDGVVDSKDQCPNTPAGAPVDARGCALDSDGDGVKDYKDKCPGTRKGAKVDMNGCEIIDSITIDLTSDEFDFDSAKLKPAMQSALNDVAARVNASAGDESLMIVGHTDSVGRDAYNQGLSERRAQSVADYLAGQGISASKMSTMGKGETSPIADNGSAEGRAKNRRVEIMTR
ncbi:MAG: OmpA family protein [Candidatus Sedimenticola sp. PURPLELP]